MVLPTKGKVILLFLLDGRDHDSALRLGGGEIIGGTKMREERGRLGYC